MGGEDPAGGSEVLGELIDQYGEAIYRDLHFFHHIDLAKVFRKWKKNKRSGTSPRLLLVLIEGLPEESNFQAARAGGREFRQWSLQTYLLAAIANNIQVNTMVVGGVPTKHRDKFHIIEGPKLPGAPKGPGFTEFLMANAVTPEDLPTHLRK